MADLPSPAASTDSVEAAAQQSASAAAPAQHTDKEIRDAWALVPALAGLIILGVAFVVLTWWAGRMMRRRMRKQLGPSDPRSDAWYSKPIVPHRPAPPPDQEGESEMGS